MFDALMKKIGIDGTPSIPKITPQDAFEKMTSGEVTLFDVREPNEWNDTGSPVGCKQVALQSLDLVSEVSSAVGGDKSSPIIVCCKSGMRGEKAGQLLKSAGFTNIQNVDGGIMRWISEKLPVT